MSAQGFLASVKARGLIFVVPLAAAGVLALAQGARQFGYLQLRQPDGRQLYLRAGTAQMQPGEGLVVPFQGEGVVAEVQLPADAAPAHRVLAPVRIDEGGRITHGIAELDVEEAGGRFMSGRLSADIGGWSLAGGLRVRIEAPRTADASRAQCVPEGRRVGTSAL